MILNFRLLFADSFLHVEKLLCRMPMVHLVHFFRGQGKH